MADDRPDWLTTGQVARLCSVKPDTVQKWIRRGLLVAQRTAGGHARISAHDIGPLITSRLGQRWYSPPPSDCRPQPLRCWEYMTVNGSVRKECEQCVVYRVRASWCFEVLGIGAESEHARQFCRGQTTCQDCAYYQRVFSLPAKVLVISADEDMFRNLADEDDQKFDLRFAANGYEASDLVARFRPNFVVLDEDGSTGLDRGLMESLLHETRVPGMKLILAVSKAAAAWRAAAPGTLVGIIEKPISLAAIAAIIEDLPVEHRVQPDRSFAIA